MSASPRARPRVFPVNLMPSGSDQKTKDAAQVASRRALRTARATARARERRNKNRPPAIITDRTYAFRGQHLVTITLAHQHRRNGQIYGPGEIRVPEELARDLQVGEELATANERRALMPQDAMIKIRYTPEGGMIAVPHYIPSGRLDEAFADAWEGHMEPAFHIQGPGR